jgi:hypothetical protein
MRNLSLRSPVGLERWPRRLGSGATSTCIRPQRVFECIEALPEHKHRRLIKVHRTVGTNYRQNWHLFAQRPYVSAPSGDAEAHSALVECVGAPIVQEGWGEEEQPL